MPEERRALHAYLNSDSKDAFAEWCAEQGVSDTGFLEALARLMGKEPENPTLLGLIKPARRIDADRRSRSQV